LLKGLEGARRGWEKLGRAGKSWKRLKAEVSQRASELTS